MKRSLSLEEIETELGIYFDLLILEDRLRTDEYERRERRSIEALGLPIIKLIKAKFQQSRGQKPATHL